MRNGDETAVCGLDGDRSSAGGRAQINRRVARARARAGGGPPSRLHHGSDTRLVWPVHPALDNSHRADPAGRKAD